MSGTARWSRRPEGSNWGEFGPDDECGRLNLLTPEKVLQGVAEVREGRESLWIPGLWSAAETPADPVRVDPRGDHRIAMSLALVGLRRPGVVVTSPEVVAKSYPGFWEDLKKIV